MEEEKTNNNEQQSDTTIFNKAKNGIVTGVKFIGKVVSGTVVTVKNSVKETLSEKEIHAKASEQFNTSAIEFTMVTPGKQLKFTKIFAQVDYDKMTLTLLGDVAHLTSNIYFVDETYRKYVIDLIKVKQSMDITIDNVVYPRTTTVIDYSLIDDEETKYRMKNILSNN